MSMRSTTSATRASSTTASRPRLLTSRGSDWGSITAYATGIVGRGVLLDAARHRGVDWLEPGEAVTRAELEAIETGAGRAARRGRHPGLPHRPSRAPPRARRLEQRLPAGGRGQGRPARRHRALDARAPHRRLPARRRRRDGAEQCRGHALSDPSPAAHRHGHVHLRQPAARGTGRRPARRRGASSSWSSGLPLRLPGATGSPWNPIAIF